MNNYIRPNAYNVLPPVTKNLIIINVLAFIAYFVVGSTFNYDLIRELGLYNVLSSHFKPIQFITSMFLHSAHGFGHILFNMFALWMFGSAIENRWGAKRFLTYYLITGLGASVLHQFVGYIRIQDAISMLPPGVGEEFINQGSVMIDQSNASYMAALNTIREISNSPAVGASGAIFGLLLAFGMMYPNSLIYLYFAIPIKAKWFVIGYGLIELYSGISNQVGDNVAHFAHLGGMIFGFILIKIWSRQEINNKRWY
jgi:membrane associated rhomboid family serine protease